MQAGTHRDVDFYPRPPRGGRPKVTISSCWGRIFLSTPSARRATYHQRLCEVHHVISIHALREEGDAPRARGRIRSGYFYPRPPRGGRPAPRPTIANSVLFLSTPSARRATVQHLMRQPHPLHFYPRPPRGGRPVSASPLAAVANFYPRPPRGGRPVFGVRLMILMVISIHALREEGDGDAGDVRLCRVDFYPRPPRGGRQSGDFVLPWRPNISIHALREEGDSKNGEKHLRFCFIIKRSAQIWKSLSKNIRKKSRDLHRMP